MQASLARRDGYGPLIPWAEAPRLPANHRYAVPQEVQTPDLGRWPRLIWTAPLALQALPCIISQRGSASRLSWVTIALPKNFVLRPRKGNELFGACNLSAPG